MVFMNCDSYLPCPVTVIKKLCDAGDLLCVIDERDCPDLVAEVEAQKKLDKSYGDEPYLFKSTKTNHRVVHVPVKGLTDYDDVRAYGVAGAKAIRRAIKAGALRPTIVLPVSVIPKFKHASLVTLLGALAEIYVPCQLRTDLPEQASHIEALTVYMSDSSKVDEIVKTALTYESGLFVARDIGGGDPEFMSAPNVEAYMRKVFGGSASAVSIRCESDPKVFEKKYPLYQAVNRAAAVIPRHAGRIIFLEYKAPEASRTLMLVGKGVTYDTGGADIKAGGVMAGMSRDKCGAAAVAGFMKIVEQLRPTNVNVIAAMSMVRNSVGEDCYVADELITSRAGVRVRVGNTDAEGRMCMADLLCEMKERAADFPDPHLFTVATLTGHACLAVGENSIVVDNAFASDAKHHLALKAAGEAIGDPFEISTLRKEDFAFHKGKCYGDDVLQCNNKPSSQTARGHQTPAAFLVLASGLDKYDMRSQKPLKFSHLDIAGSAGDFPHPPTGAPILALVQAHLLK